MAHLTVTLIGEQTEQVEVDAASADDGEHLRVAPADLARLTGWELEAEGLCRGAVCIPRSLEPGIDVEGTVDVSAFAAATGAPVVVDLDEHVVAIGVPAAERADALIGGVASPFTLPDLDGNPISLSDFAGKKKLLFTWASW